MDQKIKKVLPFFLLAAIVALAFVLTYTYALFWTGFLYGLLAVGFVVLVILLMSYLKRTPQL
ncbi:hypothetical protein POKO110462_16910 [Pontibacter korlensis]|uniref:Uncharacterized protein n=1 Tax=Pontibacter korlensis TaxID=400092 RepID=A0A0E3ZF57_9BACT|nr:hypothetical protein [Pontibacter korlensis]AKD03333.1 hypothetical protein PKOR_09635 [Pontibacter korlensis]